MKDGSFDIALVTDDENLRARALDQRPDDVRLICLTRAQLAHEAAPVAKQWWIDLVTTDELPIPPGATRVYLSTATKPAKSAGDAKVLDRDDASLFSGLWDSLRESRRGLQTGGNPGRVALPAWLAEVATLDFDRLARNVATSLPLHIGFTNGAVYRYDAPALRLVLAASSFRRLPATEIPLDDERFDARAWAALRRRRLCVADGAELCRSRHWTPPHHLTGPEPQGWLVLPLIADGALIAVLECTTPTAPGRQDPPLPPRGLQEFLGQMFGNAAAHQRVQQEARVDALTGLFNYRWMSESLEREIRRVERHSAPLSLLMLDLDGLKQINDTYGHLAGDAVLRGMADKLRESLRGHDLPARIGGDEFAAILPNTDAAAAGRVLGSLRARLAAHAIDFGDAEINSSISIGLASWRPGMTGRQLLHAADQSLYAAKAERDNHGAIISRLT